MRLAAVFLGLSGLLAALAGLLASAGHAGSATHLGARVRPDLLAQIDRYQAATWRWQRVMGVRLTRTVHSARTDPSMRYRRWVRDLWRRRALAARQQALNPPHRWAWLCIHRYEGSWTDGGAPYYGGLQMDIGFQLMYGRSLFRRKGTANNWTPLEQMWVAEKAHRSGRGFYPWPNSARYCGLI